MRAPALGDPIESEGICTYSSPDLRERCLRPAAYVIRWTGGEGQSTTCIEHAAFARSTFVGFIESVVSVAS